MTEQARIKTPETHPDHQTVGHYFKAWDGHHYYCDSYDPRIGFWMTRTDAPRANWGDEHSEYRRNISERAIDRTFHRVWSDKLIGELTAQRNAAQPKP